MEQGKIMEAEVPTVRVGTIPTGLTVPPPPQPPKFLGVAEVKSKSRDSAPDPHIIYSCKVLVRVCSHLYTRKISSL